MTGCSTAIQPYQHHIHPLQLMHSTPLHITLFSTFLRHVTRNKYMLLSCTKKSCSVAGSNRVDQEPTHHHHTIHRRRRSTTMRTVLTNWRQVTAPRCQGTAGHNTKARNRPTLQCRGERRGRWKGRSERHRNTHEKRAAVCRAAAKVGPLPHGADGRHRSKANAARPLFMIITWTK